MSEHDLLHRWLARAATRLRAGDRLRDAGLLACALLGLLALHQALRALLPVIAALTPLFLPAALGCLAAFAWRLTRRVTLAEAAAAADERAGLNDELKSAYWLGESEPRQELVALLLHRACTDAQRLDPTRLFPLRPPSSALAALGLAALCAGLSWLPPPVAATAPDSGAVAAATTSGTHAATDAVPAAEAERAARTDDQQRALWSALDELTERISASAQAEAIKRAVAARDAQRAAQLLSAVRRREVAAAAQGPAARPEGEQMTAELAQGILERLQELMRGEEDAAPAGDSPAATQSTARLAQQLREDMGDAERGRDERSSQGEMQLNAMLRAISRSTQGERQLAQGGGEAGEESGRAQTSGGAMGRRMSRTRAGGSDDEQATGDPAGELEADAVLGERTQRLQAQLQKARVERGAEDDDAPGSEGREEAFYDATQAQAAQLALREVQAVSRESAETLVMGQRTPLAYREAVKLYSLSQHRKEP